MSKQSKLATETKKAEVVAAKIQNAKTATEKKTARTVLKNFLSK